MKYVVEIAGQRISVAIDGDEVRVGDHEAVRARMAIVDGTPVRLVTIGDQVHRVLARRDGPKGTYALWMDGRRFDVDALDERTRAIRDLSLANGGPAGPRPLLAPMPGLVVRVTVTAGDRVEEGQAVIAMEAMKMENELRAPAAGVVKTVHARAGAAVEKGALLVEFE